MKVLLVVVDNESTTHWLPLGAAYADSAMRLAGHDVTVWHQDTRHYPPSRLFRDSIGFDVVAMGWIGGYQQHRMAMQLAASVPEDIPLVVGGHAPSAEPEWYKANLREVGEVEVVQGFGSSEILGCSFDVDPDDVPPYLWDFALDYYCTVRPPRARPTDRVMPVLSGRGCPYHCSFCYRMEEGYRFRDVDHIVGEIAALVDVHDISYIQFQDELLMTSPGRVRNLCNGLKRANLDIRWSCQGRVNVAHKDPSILPIMAEAGCVFINYGIESTSDEVLRRIGKKQTVEQSRYAVEATLDAGISPGLNLLWNLPGDNLDTLWGNVEFVLEHSDGAQLRTLHPVQPYPGSDLYKQCLESGSLKDAGDFYDKHRNSDLCTVSFIDGMAPEEVDRWMCVANTEIIEDHVKRRGQEMHEQAVKLYLGGDDSFRGWRQV